MFAPVGKLEEGEGDEDALFAMHHRKSIAAGIVRGNAVARFSELLRVDTRLPFPLPCSQAHSAPLVRCPRANQNLRSQPARPIPRPMPRGRELSTSAPR